MDRQPQGNDSRERNLIPIYKPLVDPRYVNFVFMFGATLMLVAALCGMNVYAIEAMRSNMARSFRALECAPDGTMLKNWRC